MRQPLLAATGLVCLFGLGVPTPTVAQICPPAPGVALPEAYLQVRNDDPTAYTFRRSWIGTAARARAQRAADPTQAKAVTAVAGTVEMPVFPALFTDAAAPYPVADLEAQLFGPSAAQTLTDYYAEISSGLLTVQGTVADWTPVAHAGAWYQGSTNGLVTGNARTGELLQEVLDAQDPGVDFGQYDNDGPDGIPNSGDDDGYVDFVAFVHPNPGGECGGNPFIWSHRWVYSAWPNSNGIPYVTTDPSANGGMILIDDYTIQPAQACGGGSMVEIGVFCHEFGHAFGLPDLYDLDGGGQGLGHWCLMATGNWNDPASPAHMGAWAKRELGWVTTQSIDWKGATLGIPPVQTSGLVYRLPLREDRWRRSTDCALSGTTSLVMGLTAAESAARGWTAGAGYGNGWRETVARDLHFDGSGFVTLSYDYVVDSESGSDFGFVLVESAGTESLVAVYDGSTGGSAVHDITPYLTPGPYRVKFRFTSDAAFSTEDGSHVPSCAGFAVDDVVISGGGEQVSAGFETHLDGFFQPDTAEDNPISEYWLLENRLREGSDQHLHEEGLLITHVDEEILGSAYGNTGGPTNLQPRGIAVEEADGQFDLQTPGGGRGDAGDVWPGSTGATAFDDLSTPSNLSNSGAATAARVTGIAWAGDDIWCTLQAGDPPPLFGGVSPASAAAGDTLVVDLLSASGLRPGLAVRLVRDGQPDLTALDVEWLDPAVASWTLDLTGAVGGDWDVVVENADGQTAVLPGGFRVEDGVTPAPVRPEAVQLAQNHPNPFNPRTTIRFQVATSGPVSLTVVDVRGRRVRELVGTALPAGYHSVVWDGEDTAGRAVASGVYFYRLRAEGQELTRRMLLVR